MQGDRCVDLTELRRQLPTAVWTDGQQAELDWRINTSREKVIVLDDDPTGTQTVHGVPVYTSWQREQVASLLAEQSRLCFILTNTRAMTATAARAVNREIAERVCAAAQRTGQPFSILHRGDSTLRGHFPVEEQAVQQVWSQETSRPLAGEILIPCFFEGGRYTYQDTHWVESAGQLVPAGDTEFARDATFGYLHSNLRHWVEEKTSGAVTADQVRSVSLEQLRQQGPGAVAAMLTSTTDYGYFIVNALDYRDLQLFALGLLQAQTAGRSYLLRTAASFVKVWAGIADRPLLGSEEVSSPSGRGGLIIAGSHVAKTSRQLLFASQLPQVVPIELDAAKAITAEAPAELTRVASLTSAALRADRTALVYTSRQLVRPQSDISEANLEPAGRISEALVNLLRQLTTVPRFLLTKGGITSSDIATRGLGIKRALAIGQLRPGIPVWRPDPGSRFPDLPLTIFPGNVGTDETLWEIIRQLT